MVKYIKNILIILIMVAFTMNAYAVSAMTLYGCAEMTQPEISDSKVPCHEVADADMSVDQDVADQDQGSKSECNKCSCGHCKVPSQASLLIFKTVNEFATKDSLHAAYIDAFVSNLFYGIEYPPKQFS